MISKNVNKETNISKNSPEIIGDLSYDEKNTWDYHVYIEEEGKYIPFIVLTSKYDGNCLLLREYLLDELISYNSSGEYGSYYCESNIDKILNEDYFLKFSENTRALIEESKIEITTKNAIDTHKDETENINRHIFLLSANEVNASLSNIAIKEGKTLDYFKKIDNRIARFDDLSAGSWILRTPALRDGNTIVGISDNGSVGIGGINTIAGKSESGIRPAFCIASDTPITQSDTIIEGKKVYLIKEN